MDRSPVFIHAKLELCQFPLAHTEKSIHTFTHTHPMTWGGGGRHDRPPGTAPNSVDPVEPHGFPVQGEKKKKKNLRIIHLVGA